MEEIILVDGYNVLNAWPELSSLKEEELAHARDRLLAWLEEFQALSGARLVVVFDAHKVPGGSEHAFRQGGVEVVFTRAGETADQWIERFVAQAAGGEDRVFVVTADWLEQRLVAVSGAYRLTPRELREEMLRLRAEAAARAKGTYPERRPLDERLPPGTRRLFEEWRRRDPEGKV